MRKILFLDVDGVLISARSCAAFGSYPAFDEVAIALLQRLCDAANVGVVLSSDWRLCNGFTEAAEAFGLPIIDRTPKLGGARGFEIRAWLELRPDVTHYAILDDRDDMLPEQLPHLVQTDSHNGMAWEDFQALCRLYEASPMVGHARERGWQPIRALRSPLESA